ncbi:MAG: protease modulator HflC [Verrucomicrobia bacterium]|jgi:membrane protease subunit HflC|nr:protease modulator HflC [Verrucomicrobiota bacterium]
MNRNPVSILIGAILLLIFVALLFVFQVRQSEIAVVTTFGRPTRTVEAPGGPYWKLPWPIQKVYKFDQRVQDYADKLTEDLTADNNNLLTQLYVGWRITDPEVFFPRFANGSVIEAEKVLEGMIRSAKSAVIGRHALSDFVSAERDVKFAQVEQEILDTVRAQLKSNSYGMDVEFLGIKRLGLPESVTQSVFDRMKSERNVLSSRSQFEGEAEAQKIRSAADRKAAELLANADAEATRIRGLGEAAAAQTLPVFQKEPELAAFLIRLSALEASLSDRTTLIFDQNSPPFDLLGGGATNALKRVR